LLYAATGMRTSITAMRHPLLAALIGLLVSGCTHQRAALSLGCPESSVIEVASKDAIEKVDVAGTVGLTVLLLPMLLVSGRAPVVHTTVEEKWARYRGCGESVTCYGGNTCVTWALATDELLDKSRREQAARLHSPTCSEPILTLRFDNHGWGLVACGRRLRCSATRTDRYLPWGDERETLYACIDEPSQTRPASASKSSWRKCLSDVDCDGAICNDAPSQAAGASGARGWCGKALPTGNDEILASRFIAAPSDAKAFSAVLANHESAQRWTQAIAAWRVYLSAANQPPLNKSFVRWLRRHGFLEEAIGVLKETHDKDPRLPGLYCLLGLVLVDAEQNAAAQPELYLATLEDPTDTEAADALAEVDKVLGVLPEERRVQLRTHFEKSR
jgi:hypothetical protein